MKKLTVFLAIFVGAFLILYHTNQLSWLPFGNRGETIKLSDEIKLIDIDVSSASTTIIPTNTNEVRAELKGKGKVSMKKDEDTIKVMMKRKWFDWGTFFNKTTLTIYIPEDYEEKMKIEVGSGNFAFDGDSIKLEKLDVEVGSGNIQLENIEAKEFTQNVSSGNIKIDTLTTKNGSLEISSGNSTIKHFTGKLKADISSGALKVQMDELKGPIDVKLSSGYVALDLPHDADFTLNSKSNHNIHNKFNLKNVTIDGKSLHGTYGSGKYPIDIDVSSGNVRIY